MLVTSLPAHSGPEVTSAIMDRYGCGTGCYITQKQLEPVSKTNIGLPRVKVFRTVIEVSPFTRSYSEKVISKDAVWIVADCDEGRLTNGAYNSNGIDKPWQQVYQEDWDPVHKTTSYSGLDSTASSRSASHWYRLCKAAGYNTELMKQIKPVDLE